MPDWFPSWHGERAIIVASGPSAVEQPIDLARGRTKVVVVNNSWQLAAWADVLYASDTDWWRENDHAGFAGLKVSRSEWRGVERVHLRGEPGRYHNDLIFDESGVVGSGGSSGFQALNLAIQFGARDIALVGFDARVDLGCHWHGCHATTLNPTEGTAAMWAYHLDRQANALIAAGILVTNCSSTSSLTAFPKTTLEHWLNHRR